MTDLRKAAEMALEAFELLDRRGGLGLDVHEYIRTKIEALRQALAQPEQEPVAWIKKDRSAIEVSIMSAEYMTNEGFEPLYTAPPKREWFGLTDEERFSKDWQETVARVEAKLKEKNSG